MEKIKHYKDIIKDIENKLVTLRSEKTGLDTILLGWIVLITLVSICWVIIMCLIGFLALFTFPTSVSNFFFKVAWLPIKYFKEVSIIGLILCVLTIISTYSENKQIDKKILPLKKEKESTMMKLDEEIWKYEEVQKSKGLIKYKERWVTPEQVKKWKEIDIGLNNNFANLSPYEFEDFISELFSKMGYDAKVTSRSGDFGADVIAQKNNEKILIEVKKYSEGTNIRPDQVQRTLGAIWKYNADKAVFITTSNFTVRAKEIEKDGPIELWNKKILHEMVRKYYIES